MIVVYRDGATPMTRRCGAPWRSSMAPRSVSPHPRRAVALALERRDRGQPPLYLSPRAAAVAEDVFGRDVDSVELTC